MRRPFLHTLLFYFVAQISLGQMKVPDIAVLSSVKDKQVLLRWAPGKENLWRTGNQYGYKVERISLNDFKIDSSTNAKYTKRRKMEKLDRKKQECLPTL